MEGEREAPATAKTETSFFTFGLPHFWQIIDAAAELKILSNLAPHARHLYSKIGMPTHLVRTISEAGAVFNRAALGERGGTPPHVRQSRMFSGPARCDLARKWPENGLTGSASLRRVSPAIMARTPET